MARPENATIAATENYTAANIGVQLETTAIRRELRALLIRYERLFDTEAIDILIEVGRRLDNIDASAAVAAEEGRTMRERLRTER